MATYYDIFGQKVQYLSSDPSDVVEGQVWYNNSSSVSKFQGFQSGAWAAGGAVSRAMANGGSATQGTKDAHLIFGGAAPGVDANPGYTESYNGTSWSNEPSYPYPASGNIGFGTKTAAVGAGGQPGGGGVNTTVEWDGSSWGSGGSLPFATLYNSSASNGPQTAGITIGGWDQTHPTGGPKTTVRVYNGTSWSVDPASCPYAAYAGNCYGSNENAVNYFGGALPGSPGTVNTHVGYDGSAFTSLPNYPLSVQGSSMAGTQTAAYAWNGKQPTKTDVGNDWDGSAWTTGTTFPAANGYSFYGGSTVGSAINAQGQDPYTPATFEFTAAGPVTKTITTT